MYSIPDLSIAHWPEGQRYNVTQQRGQRWKVSTSYVTSLTRHLGQIDEQLHKCKWNKKWPTTLNFVPWLKKKYGTALKGKVACLARFVKMAKTKEVLPSNVNGTFILWPPKWHHSRCYFDLRYECNGMDMISCNPDCHKCWFLSILTKGLFLQFMNVW